MNQDRMASAVKAVEALCKDSDGNWLDSDFSGNTVGDIREAIDEAMKACS